MGQATVNKEYKSPDYKLLSFFRHSRDGWKAKAKRRHLRIRELTKRIAALEDSRRNWREKARTCQSQIETLRQELGEQKRGSA
jgi:chromosome segregation ATPase